MGKTKQESAAGQRRREIHYCIVEAMIRPVYIGWPMFPVKLHRCVDNRGENIIYEESQDGIVRSVSLARIDALIAAYWKLVIYETEHFLGVMSADDVLKIRKLWLVTAPAKEGQFPLLTWASDPRPAHHKMPFDPTPPECIAPTPLFDELMSRTSNRMALKAWVGGLFDDRSQRQQYVWIYGDGKNGKGSLIRAISAALGSVVSSEEAPGRESKHWSWGLLGKRLIVFADCNNASFVTTGLFKSLTGEDRIRVEIKGGAILSLEIPAKFLFSSNNKPRISGSTADVRRIIYCSITPLAMAVEDEEYEERLALEVRDFLSQCWLAYMEATKGNPRRQYKTDGADELKAVISETEYEFEAFVDEYLAFDRDENGKLSPDYAAKQIWTRLGVMTEVMAAAGFREARERSALRQYLERKHEISSSVFKDKATNKAIRGFNYVDTRKRV